ncbi:GNAT family N-acetyltransferase [Pontibacter fetidus]|uniref:GNAT family N-acetyltransferase n=1 Tax=Pontibacter fetidus TaxID=2700082 RepID=A0A6B2H329_9BACT|nr:GNAT family N-acetyltransferase [Pontibacter fetidus]NDK55026.1 GNAT family N-acetyltransferase [Pontibacter fetidus]
MNNYSIRTATIADIPTIKKLAEATWEPTYKTILTKEQIDYMFEVIYTSKALENQMQDGQTFLLLFEEEIPLGFASYSLKDADANVYKLNKIYLLPGRQGKGLGKLLLTYAENEVRQLGGTILDLNVNKFNKAKQFYETCGYHVHHEEDIPIGSYWMNDYVMRKEL